VLFVWLTQRTFSQDIKEICPEAMVYENWNRVDYGPIKVSHIHGQAILDYDGMHPGSPVAHACLSLFSEKGHKWVIAILADDEGKFSLGSVSPGRYRLVARSPGLCSANVPIILIESMNKNPKESGRLLIHFTYKGHEGRSFGSLEED